jgi:predicted DCC family thiol-disulfide oxidoreductase YuxK
VTADVRAQLIYDGDCGFCTTCAGWIAARWRSPADAVPWQHLDLAGLHALGLTVDDVQQAVWWVDAAGCRFRGHQAVARALIAAGGWRAGLGRVVLVPPASQVAAVAYRAAARWRYLLPGGTPACRPDRGPTAAGAGGQENLTAR